MLHDEVTTIGRIKRILGKPSRRVFEGIGDDAAIVQSPRGRTVVTVDTMVENVHFDLLYTTARELGRRAISVAVSDLAAMAARPLYVLVSLGLKQNVSDIFIEELYTGIKEAARRYGTDVIGGNTVQSPTSIVVDVVAIGEGKQLLRRSGAKVSDVIAVTGFLGDSAAGLNLLKRVGRDGTPVQMQRLLTSHLDPVARVTEALAISRFVHAAIDLSDGLSTDLHHLCLASRVGALIDKASLPISPAARDAAKFLDSQELKWALCGGEDYELLITLDPKNFSRCRKRLKEFDVELTAIGEVTPVESGVRIRDERGEICPLAPMGWNHFVRRKVPKGS